MQITIIDIENGYLAILEKQETYHFQNLESALQYIAEQFYGTGHDEKINFNYAKTGRTSDK